MKSNSSIRPAEPSFVSQQVSEARRYYLDLNPPEDLDLVVVCGGVERMQPDYVVSRMDFPYFAVELVVEGSGSLCLNGCRYALGPGVAFAYGPGIAHTITNHPDTPMRKYYVDVTGTKVPELLAGAGLQLWTPRRIAAFHELAELFESVDREAREDSPEGRTICATLVRLLLLKIRQRAVKSGRIELPSFTTYQRLRRHMETHFSRLHTVEEVARECHVTPIYASRLFQRYGRTGAYQFLLRLRMNRAAEMLLNEGLLVKQVAAQLGFADAFQFSRALKRVYGVPPKTLLESTMRQVQDGSE